MPGQDRYTAILAHCDGTTGSSIITDSSSNALVFTTSGSAAISTSFFKFPNGSASFPAGGTSRATTPDSTQLTLGSNDFTADVWLAATGSTSVTRYVFGQSDSAAAAFSLGMRVDGPNNFVLAFVSTGGGTVSAQIVSTIGISTSAFTHLAFVRSGSTCMMFINGSQTGSSVAATITGSVFDSSYLWAIGALGQFTAVGTAWDGFLDECRLSIGVARWTANFTPPVAPYDAWLTDYGTDASVMKKKKIVGY